MRKRKFKTKATVCLILFFLIFSIFIPISNGVDREENNILQEIKKTTNKILVEEKIIGNVQVKYWIHEINNFEIKNDYILLHQKANNEIIKYEKEWTEVQYTPNNGSTGPIDNSEIVWQKLVVFPKENDLQNFYSLYSKETFPLFCREVRYNNGKTNLFNLNGKIIGNGIPAPVESKGFSLSGYCQDSSTDCWAAWKQNANSWFQKWCSQATSISLPTPETISSYVSDPEFHLFYELAHGASTYFQANLPGIYYYSYNVEDDMQNREKMRFAFIGSCEGMTNTGPGTFSHNFRKGSLDDTVTIGYSGMGSCQGWSVSLQWQDFMFYAMNSNYTIKNAFNMACAEYPTIADCVVFVGDAYLKIVEKQNEGDDDDHVLPNVVITYPKQDSIVNGIVEISGSAEDLDGQVKKVYIQIDKGNWIEASGTYSWEVIWNTSTYTDGLHNITAVAVDNNGFQSGCDYLQVYVINNPIITEISAPSQELTNTEIVFESTTTGGISPYTYNWDFGDGTNYYEANPVHNYSNPGEYIVTLTAEDALNNTAFDSFHISILQSDNIKPTIEIIKPQKGLYIKNKKLFSFPFALIFGDITIDTIVSDMGSSGVNKVEFYIDDNLKETIFATTTDEYSWTWKSPAFMKHEIKIKAYDKADNYEEKTLDIFKLF